MLKIFMVIMALMLCGCETTLDMQRAYNEKYVLDQCKRQELFLEILKAAPRGPEKITASGNDWDEVVKEAGTQARSLSIMPREYVKPECAAKAW